MVLLLCDFEFSKPIAALAARATADSFSNAASLGKYHSDPVLFPGIKKSVTADYTPEHGWQGREN
jgi:hypothetical protein